MEAVRECAEEKGVKAIIFKAPCIALTKPEASCIIDSEKCTGCMRCLKELGCPALSVEDGKMRIDKNLCTGCDLCAKLCKMGAIGGKE